VDECFQRTAVLSAVQSCGVVDVSPMVNWVYKLRYTMALLPSDRRVLAIARRAFPRSELC